MRLPSSATRRSLLVGLALAVLSWPVVSGAPTHGLDPSWHIGLALAFEHGINFGPDLIFTFGPLGFLTEPNLASIDGYRLAVLFQIVLRVGLATLLYVGARRSFSPWIAALLTYGVLLLLRADPGLVAAGAAALLLAHREREASPFVAAGFGVFAGIELLAKLSTGSGVAVIGLLAMLALPGRRLRGAAIYLATTVVTLLAGWLFTGNSLGDLPEFAGNAAHIFFGYSPAMSIHATDLTWQFPLAALSAVILAVGVHMGFRDRLETHRRVVYLLVFAYVFLLFKGGFVRHDQHSQEFFSGVLALTLVAGWAAVRSREALLAVLIAGVAAYAVAGGSLGAVRSPPQAVSAFVKNVVLTVSAGQRGEEIAKARAAMQAEYAIDPAIVARAKGHTVAVVPYEIGAVWAYFLRWAPLPVFQDYSAYTSHLDELNADRVVDDRRGPELILRNTDPPVDARVDAWDPPEEKIAILCHFRQIMVSPRWQLLERVPNRCGTPRKIKTVDVPLGKDLPNPPPSKHDLLVAKVTNLEASGLERLLGVVYKPKDRSAYVNGVLKRVVTATTPDGLLFDAPPEADYPPPFAVAPNPTTVSFIVGSGPQDESHKVHVEYYEIPIGGSGD